MDGNADYIAFLEAKAAIAKRAGLTHVAAVPNPLLKPHQADIVRWAVQGGRRAIFAAFGLGKTFMQIETLRCISAETGKPSLIVAPLGVRQEFSADVRTLATGDHPVITDAQRAALAAWQAEASGRVPEIRFIRSAAEIDGPHLYLTNYETVRDGKLDPTLFVATSLDEASCLRGMGGTKTFREFMRLFEAVPYRFVATATPSPNDYIELLAYAAYLGVMDVGEAKTRFFKRNSEKADKLTLHEHKQDEFWLWVSTWAIFLQRPSDLGHSDEGYDLPPLTIRYHQVSGTVSARDSERDGQGILIPDAAIGVTQAARAKRDSLAARIAKLEEILAADPEAHRILWHDLEDERAAIERAVPGVVSVYGSQDLDAREQAIVDFSAGRFRYLAAKPVIAGSGCNFQRHCHKAVFLGIGFKFNDFIQAIHRVLRFLQVHPVEIDVIYAEEEREILRTLQRKWTQHNTMVAKMTEIIRKYRLNEAAMADVLARSIGVERIEVKGETYRLVNNDTVIETRAMPADSVHLVVTSIPFSTQYEYTPSYNDFGHTDSDGHFWQQMGFLIPELLRVLQPGRVAAIHVKDRIVPGGINGFGFQTLSTFHMDCAKAFMAAGFAYLGMKTIVTDVVRENNQTYRLGYSEQLKDGSRMGCGVPEYLMLFRKPQTDRSKGYADVPVEKARKWWDGDAGAWQNPEGYSVARWQVDAHGFTRSSGDRLLTAEEVQGLPADAVYKLWKQFSLSTVYDFEHHVAIGEALQMRGALPPTFMLLPPHSWHDDVWTDVARMLSLNSRQAQKGAEMHLCPLQFDIVDRAIQQFSMKGETVFDPFGGLMTVPYRAVKHGRIGIGVELNPGYFLDGVAYVKAEAEAKAVPSLFDLMAPPLAPAEASPLDDETEAA